MVLRSGGSSICTTACATVFIFFIAGIVPIPALRELCISVAVLVAFILVTTVVGIISLISFDIRRRRSGRIDIFCCFPSKKFEWPLCSRIYSSRTAESTFNTQMDQLNTPASSNLLPVS